MSSTPLPQPLPDSALPSGERRNRPRPGSPDAIAASLTPCVEPPRTRRGTTRTNRAGCDVVPVPSELRAELEGWVERYTQAAVEIVAGDRPAAQLVRWNRPDVHQDLVRRAVLVARAGRREPGQGRPPGATRAKVHNVRLSFLDTETVEAAVHLRHGDRSRAVAGRFQVHRGRWICTALEFS